MNIVEKMRRVSPVKLAAGFLLAAIAFTGGTRAYAALTADDCCAPGAACCHPGAACCHARAKG